LSSFYFLLLFQFWGRYFAGAAEAAEDLDSGLVCYGEFCLATWAAVEGVLEEEDLAAVALVEAAVALEGLAAEAPAGAGRSAVIRKRELRWFRKN